MHLGLGILKVAAVAIATMKVKEKFQIVMKLHRNDPCDVQMCKKCLGTKYLNLGSLELFYR